MAKNREQILFLNGGRIFKSGALVHWTSVKGELGGTYLIGTKNAYVFIPSGQIYSPYKFKFSRQLSPDRTNYGFDELNKTLESRKN